MLMYIIIIIFLVKLAQLYLYLFPTITLNNIVTMNTIINIITTVTFNNFHTADITITIYDLIAVTVTVVIIIVIVAIYVIDTLYDCF